MIISLSGPSGIGKGFIKEQLMSQHSQIQELSWLTTRPKRPGDNSGNRIYVSLSEFNRRNSLGELVLVQDLFGHRYGLKKEDLSQKPNITLTELHPSNLSEALRINPQIVAIGLVTTNLLLLYRRLSVIRKTESPSEIGERIASAKMEIEMILRHQSLFVSVIEVTSVQDPSVLEKVKIALAPHLAKEGLAHGI